MHGGLLDRDALITASLAEGSPGIRGAGMPVSVRPLYNVPSTAAPIPRRYWFGSSPPT